VVVLADLSACHSSGFENKCRPVAGSSDGQYWNLVGPNSILGAAQVRVGLWTRTRILLSSSELAVAFLGVKETGIGTTD
jgi:hypothetical protein